MPDDAISYDDVVSRRRFVELAGLSGTAALAGCGMGGDTGSGNQSAGAGDGTTEGVVDRTFTNMSNGVPDQQHVNQLNQQNYEWDVAWLMHERYAAWNFAKEEFEMGGLESWEFGEDTVTLNIREDLTWDDGDDYTTEDMETHWDLLTKVGDTVTDFTESYEAVDDKTFELTLSEQSHPKIMKFSLAQIRMFVKHDVFQEYVDQDASAIQTFKWQGDSVVGNGPFSLESATKQAWNLERNDGYYDADNVNFSGYETLRRDSNTAQQQALIGNQTDGVTSLFCPAETVEKFPDVVEEVNLPAKWGYGVLFNHDHEHFGERAVRQAVAYVVNRQSLVENAGPNTKFVTPAPCGIAPQDQEPWLGDAMSDFEDYGPEESLTEEATAVLEEAGYEKSGGTWQDAEGNAVSADYLTPGGWTDFTTMTNTVVDQLNEFGFDVSVDNTPWGDMSTQYSNGDFAFGAMYWLPGGARSTFPYFPLRFQVRDAHVSGGHNYPREEITVPAMDGDGDLTIDPLERAREIATTGSDEEAEPIVREVAYHNNQDVPMLGLVSKYEQSWLTTDEWDVAAEDDASRQVKWPPIWMPRKGTLSAKE